MRTAPDANRLDSIQPSGLDTVLLRIVGWGTAAALALGVAVFAAQSPTGTERIQVALSGGAVVPQTPFAANNRTDPSVVALQAKLERLSSDRDRLEARLATLEHGLDDVTGSIRSQSEQRSTSVQTARAVNPPIIEPPLIPPMETLTLTPKAPPQKAEEALVPAAPETAAVTVAPEPPKTKTVSEPAAEVHPAPPTSPRCRHLQSVRPNSELNSATHPIWPRCTRAGFWSKPITGRCWWACVRSR